MWRKGTELLHRDSVAVITGIFYAITLLTLAFTLLLMILNTTSHLTFLIILHHYVFSILVRACNFQTIQLYDCNMAAREASSFAILSKASFACSL